MLQARPKRRGTTHVETLHGELCIYEWTTKTVHALNPAAARVWEMCDGTTAVEEMAAAVRRDLHAPGATAIVEHALAQFDRAGLLEPGTLAVAGPLVSRRALLRRIGVAAAIPVVTSIVAPTPLAAQSGNTVTFNSTGAPQSFTVPAGISSLHVDAVGGSGGGNVPPFTGGRGGRVQAILPVTPAEVLTIMVGGNAVPAGGFNGGGPGTPYGGGGASDIRRGAVKLVVAGGGGVGNPVGGLAGAGGGLVGQDGGAGGCGSGAGGGTQSAGGAGGSGSSATGSPGVSGTGGAGATGSVSGSGGGGGYFGGGGSGACSTFTTGGPGGGGGGSSFTDPSATSVVHTQGFGGSPHITLSW